MRHAPLLCLIGLTLSSCAAAGSQTTDAGALSASLRADLQNERFQTVTSIRGLPLGVRDGLQTLFGSQTLDIADPGAELEPTGVANSLPTRRLVAAACSTNYCLVHYERLGNKPTWHVTLFHWTPDATRFEWGGTASGALATHDEVRQAILAGRIKGPATVW
ncbi:MAG: hypothetical protein Q8O42_04940 [Acidobacteriota bacterium]|nr:hypothetical protein [Acidobacteriota bacterium]